MKYFDINSVVNSYMGFQNSMTNKSWGYLAILKGCKDEIKPNKHYEVNVNDVANFLEGIFNLSTTKKTYDGGRTIYVIFSKKWDKYFQYQGGKTPNICDVVVWSYRRKGFPDDYNIENIISEFSDDFHIPSQILHDSFVLNSHNISFSSELYTENELKQKLSDNGIDVSTENIDAKKSKSVASPGETSRGPFVQPLYSGLDITDYVLILQSDYYSTYESLTNKGNEKEKPETVREGFEFFLKNCVKSKRGENILGTLSNNAIRSYLQMLDKRADGTIKLFDYNPTKWQSIKNIYEITDTQKAESIYEDLMSDTQFTEWDRKDNSSWRSGAMNYYVLYLRTREHFSKITKEMKKDQSPQPLDEPLQQIFYGAPGTGKSDTIYETTKDLPEVNVFRTTFHPDSDYSTFVGAYKPTMKSSEKKFTPEELTVKLKEIKNSGTPYPCHKFSAKYWKSLKDLSAESIKKILSACGFTEAYSVEVSKGVAIGQEYMDKPEDGRITYTFCPQAFTNAYVRAWQTEEPVFLIIEEINRGNCAQIFGDLFQLLDRDEDGYSKYEIVADNDLANHIKEKLENADDRENLTTSIKEGRELKLPNNLYIWATMNTSDQSLFPIDSAFKRRWDWKYIKIKKGVDKETKQPLNWKIKVGEGYDWWEFINKINDRIVAMTSTADKQLGYFFCLADNNEISADTFVNKVAFYLWNDVFKDYAEDGSPLLKYKKKEDDKEESDLTFPDFFDEQGKIDENVVKQFIDHVIKDEKTENKAE